MTKEIDRVELTAQYEYIGRTGRICFARGFYPAICKTIGIQFSDLSKTGKMILKCDAIDTAEKGYDCYKTKEEYEAYYL